MCPSIETNTVQVIKLNVNLFHLNMRLTQYHPQDDDDNTFLLAFSLALTHYHHHEKKISESVINE